MADSNITQLTSLMISPNTNTDSSNTITLMPGQSAATIPNIPTITLDTSSKTTTEIASNAITLSDAGGTITLTPSSTTTIPPMIRLQDDIDTIETKITSDTITIINDNVPGQQTTINCNSISTANFGGVISLAPGDGSTNPQIMLQTIDINQQPHVFSSFTIQAPIMPTATSLIYILPSTAPTLSANQSAPLVAQSVTTNNNISTIQLGWGTAGNVSDSPYKSKKSKDELID